MFDKEGVSGLGIYKTLIDLKITNEIHSSELSNSVNCPTQNMILVHGDTAGRNGSSVIPTVKYKSFASQ